MNEGERKKARGQKTRNTHSIFHPPDDHFSLPSLKPVCLISCQEKYDERKKE